MSVASPLYRELVLLATLYDRTKRGAIRWEATQRPDTFVTESGGFRLSIAERQDPAYVDNPDYLLQITDAESGRSIHTISNVSLRAVSDIPVSSAPTPYRALQEIYETARRSALSVDDAIERLIETLSEA